MISELDQITSILSKVCVILIITWLVIKSWQFKKYISYYIKMTQPEDQVDQLLLQASPVASSLLAAENTQDSTKIKKN